MASADVCSALVSSHLLLFWRVFFLHIISSFSHVPPQRLLTVLSLSFHPAEENSFVALDHSGILPMEFVSLLEETEFTILIEAYPAPKVLWLKDGNAISGNYYIFTSTSHLEGNR